MKNNKQQQRQIDNNIKNKKQKRVYYSFLTFVLIVCIVQMGISAFLNISKFISNQAKIKTMKTYKAKVQESLLYNCDEFEKLLSGRDDYFDFTQSSDFDLMTMSRGVIIKFDGYIKEYELASGQQIVVDTGYLAAMTGSCKIEVKTVPGVKNMLFGGEGIFNTVITGPGRVWLQSMPIAQMANTLRPYFPSNNH